MMAPATGFYSTPGKGKREVRLAYVLNVESLRKAAMVLEKALEQYPNRIDVPEEERVSASGE